MIKNQNGFTLIEMLIVLLIISVLLIITIPNVAKYNTLVEDKGCEAFKDLVRSEVQIYKIQNGTYPTDITSIDEFANAKVNNCTDWTNITINENGEVSFGDDS